MRGIFTTVIVELPQPQQVWNSGRFSKLLSEVLAEITGTKFRVHVTAGAALAVPEGSPASRSAARLLGDIVEGHYRIPQHRDDMMSVPAGR